MRQSHWYLILPIITNLVLLIRQTIPCSNVLTKPDANALPHSHVDAQSKLPSTRKSQLDQVRGNLSLNEEIIDHLQSISLMTTGSQAARASEKEDGMIRKADGGKINRICLFSAAYFIELMQAIRCMQSLFRTVKR
ncbi:hypothetical protein M514_01061 [Trichuris suis]|uniref:Uncharacterized protein n=1 Tax=Trichuris suis TaxID=68888 RepID=A0A085MM52_9BILA|nr:hypothetical protein M513_01061 [Trichuris suis]KFD70563.1 hypothetical protein M514_01061 [Trichuris suis]